MPNQYEDKSQKDLIDFVTSESTIRAAAEGSMEKRQAVFDQYEDKELDAILHDVYLAGWNDKLCDDNPTYVPSEHQARLHAMQLITQKQLEARIDEKQHAVQLIYGMEKAQMAIDELNDEIAELTKQEGKG